MFKPLAIAVVLQAFLTAGVLPASQRGILTPPVSPKPSINGPSVYGVRPGHPFIYLIPATGRPPLRYSAQRLPKVLKLDPKTGIITGSVEQKGDYPIRLRVHNSLGSTERTFHIVVGNKIALTPPMGWSTWYMAYAKISDKLVRREADALVSSGLAAHGYSYVDIDDGWNVKVSGAGSDPHQAPRDAQGNLNPNSKFPNMKALTNYVHSKGLKIGIYISPGPRTCGGYEGSYGHEKQDAQLFAKWGFDLLKYDLCSYRTLLKNPNDPDEVKRPYQLMGSALQNLDRDVVFNLCEYGLGHVWTWGRSVGGNFWRTNGDVGSQHHGLWQQMTNYGLAEAGEAKWAGPGGWNDPDNILIGRIMWKGKLQPTPLTHNEQYTYVTLWSLLDAPLVFGGDATQLDPFTLSLLTNDEVIAVDQDSLGKQAVPVFRSGNIAVWAKDMKDGSKAVGLFNLGDTETEVTARWSDLGITGKHLVRDLWRQKNLGVFDHKFHASVGEHGAELFLVKSVTQKKNRM